MKHPLLTFILLIILMSVNGFSQDAFFVSGKVIDSKTKESLAFVNIVINNNSNKGGTTDIDGKFNLQSAKPIQTLSLSYVGFEPLNVTIDSRTKGIIIQMTQKDIDLREVEILPGINPAHHHP